MKQGGYFQSFYEIDNYEFSSQLLEKIKHEIESQGKEYVLSVDEDEFKNYLVEKYTLTPLIIDRQSETIDEPRISKETRKDEFRGDEYTVEAYNFTVRYSYSGSTVLFKVKPSSRMMVSREIYTNDQLSTVSFKLKLHKKDPDQFLREKNKCYQDAFTNLQNVNLFALTWNGNLQATVDSYFRVQKKRYQEENDFFAAINVKVNADTISVFTTPTLKKKIIPQPEVSKRKELASEPSMAMEMYYDVLRVIYDFGKSMEKKPSTYKNKNEEALRDQFLLLLETRYEGTTATGETFNSGGKTDIILKYAKDNSNLFVAECKFWHGTEEFLGGITQLFDKYLTWRDSKTSLMIFVTNKDFTNTIQTIKTKVKLHPYYLKENGARGETSLSYIFHLPQDKNKAVLFEIIAFHFNK